MKSRLVGYFYGRRAEVLAWIEREAGRASSFAGKRAVTMTEFDAWLSGQRERWDAIIARETKPATEQAVSQSFARLEDILGMPLESAGMSHPEVLRFLEEQGARKGRFVNATLSETLRTEMRGLLTQEATIKDISERMRDVFRVSARHATTIARTEVGAATNGATYLGYKLEGIEKHSWLSAMDEKVRHTHQIDGEIRTVGEAFSNGLMYPMDVGGPAEEVINCRCTTVPEV